MGLTSERTIDTKLLIYGLFQKGRVLAQDGVGQLALRQLNSNGTARVGGGHRGVTEIVRSLESTLETYPR